jgi:hypothetical protein
MRYSPYQINTGININWHEERKIKIQQSQCIMNLSEAKVAQSLS